MAMTTPVTISGNPRLRLVGSSTWLPLSQAVICLEDDCNNVFDIAEGQCPRCASDVSWPLSTWLRERNRKPVQP